MRGRSRRRMLQPTPAPWSRSRWEFAARLSVHDHLEAILSSWEVVSPQSCARTACGQMCCRHQAQQA